MKKYQVYVSREECQYIEVEASSKDEAGDLATQEAEKVIWDDTPRFEVLAIEEEEEHGNEEENEEGSG